MAINLLEQQRNAIVKMLDLGSNPGWGGAHTWKVLVYDKFCQEVVAPLLKVGGLRSQGVTLITTLKSDRQPVADVPCVYFVVPTEENIKRIQNDLAKGLYENYYINFVSAVPQSLFEELATGAMRANVAQKVAGVFDRYLSFVSLSPTLFSLNMPEAYSTIHSPSIADQVIQQYIERIVEGLLSVLITLKSLPIIRCPPNEVAEMVARRLEQRIRSLLQQGGTATAGLFSSSVTSGVRSSADSGPNAGSQRLLLCILDRDVDLVTMLNHTWTYQAMAHDIFGMKLNKMTVPVENKGENSTPPKPKSYDVDENDNFWVTHAGDPFPEVMDAVQKTADEFAKNYEELTKSGESRDPTTSSLAAAMNSLPEMTEKKRSLEMHTNIATALLNEVQARELDRYYVVEDQFSSQSLATSCSQLEQLIKDKQKGTVLDKTRALMVLYLTKPSISQTQLQVLKEALQSINGDDLGLAYLQHLANIRNILMPSPAAEPSVMGSSGSSGASALLGNTIGGLANRVQATGKGLLAAGISNLRTILLSKKELVICKILDGLMEQKTTGMTENYIYLDPKAQPGAEVSRIRTPFRKALAFVVGGGNYVEMQSVQEWAQANGRHVIYGSTDIPSPAQFVDELSNLGQALCGGNGGL